MIKQSIINTEPKELGKKPMATVTKVQGGSGKQGIEITSPNGGITNIILVDEVKKIVEEMLPSLDRYVKYTDTATDGRPGVVATGNGFDVGADGKAIAKVVSFITYRDGTTGLFVSKGTLESVLDAEVVRFDKRQDIDDEGKLNAIENIGSISRDEAYDLYDEAVSIAEGKASAYICSKATNPSLDSEEDRITVASLTTMGGKTLTKDNVKLGDIIYVSEDGVPDRWVVGTTETGFSMNKFETEKPDLSDHVTFTDFANNTKAGIILPGWNGFGTFDGRPFAGEINYNSYKTSGDNTFIGKTTLENVLDNEALRIDKEQTLTDEQKSSILSAIGVKTESWTFTLEDGTEVTKTAIVGK